MPPAIAEAMNFSFYKGVMGEQTLEPKQQVINYLKRKSVLLILDNFEHLLEGSEITTEILQAAPGVKIIATSRARLNVFEEHTCLIPGMQYPVIEEQPINKQVLKEGLEFSAIKLFVQAAGWAQPEFALTEKNLPDVIHICRLVEGMPLGIILSAAWLSILSLEEIAAEIEKGLDILEGELRDLPDRQRSLRAVFDSSWRLLGEREQKVFAALSVFRGGCTRIAAQQVTGASLKELMTLVNCSLIQREASGRYTMHRLLHQYADEKLSEDQVSQRIAFHHHSDYFANRLVDWEKDLISSRQAEALNEMDAEHENCQAAWQQALEQKDITRLSSMLGVLHRYYCLRQRHHEGESIFHQAAEKIAEITSPEGLRLLCGLLARQADLIRRPLDLAMEFFDQAQDALDSLGLSAQDTRRERADFLRLKANILQETDQHILRKDSLEESLELYRELDDRWAIAEVMRLLGEHNWWIGSLDQSTLYYEQSVTRFQALGDPSGAGLALTMLAAINMGSDPIDKSEEMQREALALFRKTGDPFGQYHSLAMLGVLYILFRADFNRARTFIL